MNTENPRGCDLLVLSPHTDDAEIGLGGTLALLADRGARVWVVDLTRGELGSNATPDERWAEAAAASRILRLTGRAQLDLPDGFIDPQDPRQVQAVVWVLRSLRPRWVATAPDPVRHPDHRQMPLLAEKASFLSRLAALQPAPPAARCWTEGGDLPAPAESWGIEALFSVCPSGGQPSLLFDVTAAWERKAASLACFASQFQPGQGRRPTMINDPDFLARIERRARNWGRRAGCRHAEALRTEAAPVLTDLPQGRWSA